MTCLKIGLLDWDHGAKREASLCSISVEDRIRMKLDLLNDLLNLPLMKIFRIFGC